MFSNAMIYATAALLGCSSFAAAAPQGKTSEVSLTTKLRLADTFVDRYSLLPEDKDFLFNFNSTPSAIANSQTFPALTGSGLSLASAQIPGCSMIMLHTHPRASELFAVMSGRVYTEAVPESGVLDAEGKPRVIRNEIGAGQATIFYQGTKHYQVNPDCEPASAIAAFPSEDIGFAAVAPGLFSIKNDAVIRLLGEAVDGEDIEKIRASIPMDMGIKVDECLAKCVDPDLDISSNTHSIYMPVALYRPIIIVTAGGVYGYSIQKRVSKVDRSLITRFKTVPEKFQKSRSVSEVVNAKQHIFDSDSRYITLDIPPQHRDVSDEVLLAKFVKGYFGGSVIRPERVALSTLGMTLVNFSKSGPAPRKLWSCTELPEVSLPPVNTILYGVFQVLETEIGAKVAPNRTESHIDFGFGSDSDVFAGVHRFVVVRTKQEMSEEKVQIHYESMACNPMQNKPLRPRILFKFHEFYADLLFRDAISEIKQWMGQS
ncbi:hypothetical protein FPRO06_05790 [Fusarium proliferatum]|nr:hypothetical protein FPRO06_05790 [Fusarium proliferatum]